MEQLVSAKELRRIVNETIDDATLPAEDLAEGWLYWFQKRGERYLTSAAKFGYTEATLDLPKPLATTMNKPVLRALLKRVRELVPGCAVCIVEEEYEGAILFRLEISWAVAAAAHAPSTENNILEE